MNHLQKGKCHFINKEYMNAWLNLMQAKNESANSWEAYFYLAETLKELNDLEGLPQLYYTSLMFCYHDVECKKLLVSKGITYSIQTMNFYVCQKFVSYFFDNYGLLGSDKKLKCLIIDVLMRLDIGKLESTKEVIQFFNHCLSYKNEFTKKEVAFLYSALGYLHCLNFCFQEALTCFQNSLEYDVTSPIVFANASCMAANLNDYILALGYACQALVIKPDYVEALYNKGNALIELKRYQEALNVLQKCEQEAIKQKSFLLLEATKLIKKAKYYV